jgi:Diaminopimelate decarboxylase
MKQAFLSAEKAREIASVYPTPVYVYDEEGIRKNAEELYRAFSWNKGFKEFFAVKATPNPAILRLLKSVGCGLDCSSFTELRLAEKLGITGGEIMFSSNETAAKEYVLAEKLGAIINLDDITHIEYLKRHIGKIPEKICLRYNPGGEFKIGTFVMGNPAEAKYGLTRPQMTEAVKKLMKSGAKEFGIHSFLASNTTGNDYYPELAKILFKTVAELTEETGAKFVFVNLSGGIGVPYRPEQEKADIFKISEGVEKAYVEILAAKGIEVKLFTELGRYMLAPYGGLLTTAIHFKHTYREYVGTDACAANLMRPAIYGAYHHITVLGKENAPADKVYDVVGSLCENSDKFAVNRSLPEVEEGDLLFVHDAGAHGHSMGYNYNGKAEERRSPAEKRRLLRAYKAGGNGERLFCDARHISRV